MAKGFKTGGRKPGSRNIIPSVKKEDIASNLFAYFRSPQFSEDFLALDPRDRLIIAEKYLKYILPSMQSIAADLSLSEAGQSLEERLSILSGMTSAKK